MAQAQREWFEKDYYKVLGVPQDAAPKEITKAYRRLAKQFHPDSNPGSEDKFKEVSSAYDVLGDAEKRSAYDDARRLGPMGSAGMGSSGSAGFDGFNVGDFSDLGDLFGGLFGPGRRAATNRRGADVEAATRLSFEDAAKGAIVGVSVTGEATCDDCSGSGAAPGTSPVVCSACSGRGVKSENQGLFSFSRPCESCAGRGMVVETPCPACRGRGAVRKTRTVNVRIPAGVKDGQRIRLAGKGAPGQGRSPAGDLFVTVHVDRHGYLGRKGKDLTIALPITFPEAALGSEIQVPTLGRPVTVRIPAGTNSGKVFRVRGKGLEFADGTKSDLLVTVEVVVPKRLSDAERRVIKELADTQSESPRSHLVV